METKNEKIENLLQAAKSLTNAIYWLKKEDKVLDVANLYEILEDITGEASKIASEVKTEVFNA